MSRITPAQAGKVMGVSAEFVRLGLQQGRLPIGVAVKAPGAKRWAYYISGKLLKELTGKEVEEDDT